jgi:hypothetical protein
MLILTCIVVFYCVFYQTQKMELFRHFCIFSYSFLIPLKPTNSSKIKILILELFRDKSIRETDS